MAKPLERGDPKRVGPYEVLGRLGEGGMGKVFLARSREGLLVAVKVVHPRLMRDAGARRRFEREVRAARRIDGTYTAAVVAADVNADPPWLATVYVPAFPLSDVLTRLGPLAEESVRALGVGLAEAVTAIHAAEIIHRDLKPSNVLVTPGGPKVTDFGISALAQASTLTRPGEVVGTLGFMAPEQLAGNAVPASDVFSVRCCPVREGRVWLMCPCLLWLQRSGRPVLRDALAAD